METHYKNKLAEWLDTEPPFWQSMALTGELDDICLKNGWLTLSEVENFETALFKSKTWVNNYLSIDFITKCSTRKNCWFNFNPNGDFNSYTLLQQDNRSIQIGSLNREVTKVYLSEKLEENMYLRMEEEELNRMRIVKMINEN